MEKLTIPQKLEALQAVNDNPDINWADIPHHYCTDDIITPGTPCRMTDKGQALWERFTKHLNNGYKKLTTGERIFWLTAYTGDHRPDDTQLLGIARTSTSSEVRVVAAWLNTHPEASDDIIHHWLIDGWDGVVGAAIQSIDPTRLPLVDIPEILDAPHSLSEWTRTSFARVARHLTVPQLEILLDRGIATVTDMLIFGAPFTDEQWKLFDKRDHEAVENALWEYRRYAHSLQKERERLFINPDCEFAARVDKSCLSPAWDKGEDWTTV